MSTVGTTKLDIVGQTDPLQRLLGVHVFRYSFDINTDYEVTIMQPAWRSKRPRRFLCILWTYQQDQTGRQGSAA
jgi:hypothetical protein